MTPVLAFRDVHHRFGAVQALEGVHLEAHAGEVHAVLGENGAGKTTLLCIALGLITPDRGQVEWDGRPILPRGPAHARALGLGMVHQHFTLVERMSVAENLALGETQFWQTARGLRRRAREVMATHGLPLDPDARVEDLSVGERQRLEILKALDKGSRILVLDEPTAVLTPAEVEDLFGRLRHLRDEGRAILLITHRLPEVAALADRVTVLRNGRVQASGPVREFSSSRLARLLAGDAPSPDSTPADAPVGTPPVLQVVGLEADGVGPLDLRVQAGEIVGVAGVAGNGQGRLMEVLVGLRDARRGEFQVPPDRAFLAGDRHGTALALDLPVAENLALRRGRLPGLCYRRRGLEEASRTVLRDYDVRCQSPWQPTSTLSGGNQQKLVAARELHGHPSLVLAEDPTRGLDLGATRFLRERLRQAARDGAAVLLVSTDLDEILELAHRVFVADRGRLFECAAEREAIARRMAGLGSEATP